MLTREEYPEINVWTERLLDDVETDALATLSGSEFQMEEAAGGKAQLPTMESLTDSTMSRNITR